MVHTAENILSLIPQGPPFVMIDKLLYSDETSSRSQLEIRADNIFVKNNFFREPGLIENIAQTGAARAGYNSQKENKPVQVGYIGAIKNFEVFSLPKVGDIVETEIAILNQVFDVTLVSGKIKSNGTLIAQCEMKIFLVKTK
ncbi:MAG: 3-hydroxyacyl-ACP dehydratase [Sphingobacteriales bacterium]|nr:3-hydroxyacyl-ACP dehydratase [Sphingobacteriales bacterium]